MSPFILIVFGATGDLMHRKLMPAIGNLWKQKEIGDVRIIGVGRRNLSQEEFRSQIQSTVSNMTYVQGMFEDQTLYRRLKEMLNNTHPKHFYLAVPPEHYETILTQLSASKLSDINARILIEKPFGKDLTTARHLEKLLSSIFQEKQIYRIDHYLGKETIQNILSFRFANGIFEPTWNDKFIDHVQVALLEDTGIDSRGQFYDGVGAIRDVVQNHMLQMLALTAMEQPFAFDAASIRKERARVLRSIELSGDVVRGQYEEYRTEKNVDPKSQTETFAAVKLMVNLPRWKNVPFYLRTGKKLKKKMTEISLHYKKPEVCTGPVCLFPEPDVMRNVLSLRIHPDDGIHLRLMVKKPGFGMKLTDTPMAFHYKDAFPDFAQPEAYEKLLLDAIRGDQTLFAHSDEIEASWKVITKILESLLPAHAYASGSWGPKEGEELIKKDSRHWFLGRDDLQ